MTDESSNQPTGLLCDFEVLVVLMAQVLNIYWTLLAEFVGEVLCEMQQPILDLAAHNAELVLLELVEQFLVGGRLVKGGMEGTSDWLMGLGRTEFPQGCTSTDDQEDQEEDYFEPFSLGR